MALLDEATVRRFVQHRVNLPKHRERTYNEQVQSLRNQFQRYASAHPELTVKKLLKSGSLGKRTHTSQLNDIDIAAYVDAGEVDDRTVARVDGPALVRQVHETLVSVLGASQRPRDIQTGNSAVKIHFRDTGLDVDFVPVIIDHSSTADEGWVVMGSSPVVRTCIPRHQQFIRGVEQAHPDFLELVRLLKWWRDVHRAQRPNFRVRSFLLELTAAHLCREHIIVPSRPLDAFRGYLNWVHTTRLRHPIAFEDWHPAPPVHGPEPAVFDPANPANNVAEKLARNPAYHREFVEVARLSHEAITHATSGASTLAAKRALTWVLGPAIEAHLP